MEKIIKQDIGLILNYSKIGGNINNLKENYEKGINSQQIVTKRTEDNGGSPVPTNQLQS